MNKKPKNGINEEPKKGSELNPPSKNENAKPKEPQGDPEGKPQSENAPDALSPDLKQHTDSLKGQIANRDKLLKEKESKQIKLEKRLAILENRSQVTEMILDSDFPNAIKQVLKKKIDALTPENFSQEGEALKVIYDAGVETQKKNIDDFVSKKPEKTLIKDFDAKLGDIDVHDPDAMDKLLELGANMQG